MSNNHLFIEKLEAQDIVKCIYLVRSASKGNTAKGDAYWSLKLADNTGQIDSKIWAPLANQFDALKGGDFISIEAGVQSYKDTLQLVINSARVLDKDEIEKLDLALYTIASPIPKEDLKKELDSLIKENISYKPWAKFIDYMMKDERIAPYFDTAPAAKAMHHAYLHGLLEHTLGVAKVCVTMANLYPQVDKELLIVGALFHDIGKIEEMSGVLSTEYTHVGKLLGHTIICLGIMEEYLKKAEVPEHLGMHLKHLIISHHGLPEYGAVKMPATTEAWLLHYADNIDAKANRYFQIKRNEEEIVQWHPSAGFNQQFAIVERTPTNEVKEKKSTKKEENKQLSLDELPF